MIGRVTSFDETFPVQAKQAERLQNKYDDKKGILTSAERVGMARQARSVASSILDDDPCYCLANGKTVKFTESVKHQILYNSEDFIRYDVMDQEEANGQCLLCARKFVPGDISLRETDGSGNAICLECCSDQVKLTKKSALRLCKYIEKVL